MVSDPDVFSALQSIGTGTSSTYSKRYVSNCCQPATVTVLVMEPCMLPEGGQQHASNCLTSRVLPA